MLLIDPKDLANIFNATCGGREVESYDKGMVSVLRLVTPRVEEAMNVATLTRGIYTDTFMLASQDGASRPAELRLSNGIVVPGTVKVIGPDGEMLGDSYVDEEGHNYEMGVVSLARWGKGRYKVQYESGYEVREHPADAPDWLGPDDRVLLDVPDWIHALVANFFVLWRRTARATPQVNEKISYGQVDAAIRKEITARLYGRYQRPRVGLTFSDRLTYG